MSRRLRDMARSAVWSATRVLTARTGTHSPSGLAVLVHSFDGYKRFWKAAAFYTTTNLPTDSALFFATEETPFSPDRFRWIGTGRGSYATRLLAALRSVENAGFDYVLYLQEDIWLTRPVEGATLTQLEEIMGEFRLDSLKLGIQPFPEEHADIRETSDALSDDGPAARFRWFGSHRYVLSHHPSIFRVRFLIDMAFVSRLFGRSSPLDQERFCSGYLKSRTVARNDDGRRYRVAVFESEPIVEYVHAAESGRLTDEAIRKLATDDLEQLFDPGLPGEVLPP